MVEAGRLARELGGPGFEVVERVRASIARYDMLTADQPCVVGVSGGPDSLCLLDVLLRLGMHVIVAHVDHGLATTGDDIAARVAKLAAEAGVDVHVARAGGLAGPNLHARARAFRYAFFETIARDNDADRIATAHTLDDRVETTIARLIHGGGTSLLAGLRPVDGVRIHPLIGLRRTETRNYCDERELPYVVDPANDDLRFERARVRNAVLPAIEQGWGDGAIEAIASAAGRLAEDAAALEGIADSLYPSVASEGAEKVSFERAALMRIPRALRRRLFERAVGRVRDRSGGIEAALDALDARDGKRGPTRYAVAAGIEIAMDRDEVTVARPPDEHSDGPAEERV